MRNLVKVAKLKEKRRKRVRKKLKMVSNRPRLCVIKSNKHIFVQVIDDTQRATLISLGTLSKSLKGTPFAKKSMDSAAEIGKQIATMAKAKGIDRVVFDRGRYKYHGIIAKLADAAREAGLQF
jgi:large subunit ribosomal protein L18